MQERLTTFLESFRASFGAPTGLAIVAGVLAGFLVPGVSWEWAPTLAFESTDGARSVLSTIATTTVSVAGLAFSVTLVAFTLASTQLSPRVLRSFRRDRLVQWTLAAFIGTFLYALSVLVHLNPAKDVPQIAVTLALLLAIVSFSLFTWFIAHIVAMLQPSSVISGLADDARSLIHDQYPSAGQPASPEAAAQRMQGDPREVRAEHRGYLTDLHVSRLLEAATAGDAIVRQVTPHGRYVVPGDVLAHVWGGDEDTDEAIRGAFRLGSQRTLVQDIGFPIRQLADIALRGLSPSLNDPTTAQNAMEAMAGVLIEYCRSEHASPVRADGDGVPRFVAEVPSIEDLVTLGFEEVRHFAAADYPRLMERLTDLQRNVVAAADEATEPRPPTSRASPHAAQRDR